MSKSPCIAVLDIGKTNKKVVAYDAQLNVLKTAVRRIDEVERDGFVSDNVEEIRNFFFEKLCEFNREYEVKAISISAHGATFCCIDENGDLSVPQVSYTTDPGPELDQKFYAEFGAPEELQKETATASFNLLLNVARGIYFVRDKFPEGFARTEHILNYNSYWGYLLTGNVGAEYTYMGCHSFLWDFHANQPSSVARKMGIADMLPTPLNHPWDVLGTISPAVAQETGLAPDTILTHGLHDSNAALVPYMCSVDHDFVLNSTGTWCVDMHEADDVRFTDEELGKTVFFNLNAYGRPVKTSIFLGGAEFEAYADILKSIHGDLEKPQFDPELCQQVINDQRYFIMPSVTPGTGQFPQSEARIIEAHKEFPLADVQAGKVAPEFLKDQKLAHAVLDLSLVMQTTVALERVGCTDGLTIFTEGGFRRDATYNGLLASFYPNSECCITNLEEASAVGAAVCAKCTLENVDPKAASEWVSIDRKEVKPFPLSGMGAYRDAFLARV
ncbi:MAG: FGGY family carbohydrate kinase [Lentisphaeria bacterium]